MGEPRCALVACQCGGSLPLMHPPQSFSASSIRPMPSPYAAEVDPVGTDLLVALLADCRCKDVHPERSLICASCMLWGTHLSAVVRAWHDAEKAEAVREALDELIEAHTETFGPAGSASRMWLRERRAALEQS
jgi:hypothetical protein